MKYCRLVRAIYNRASVKVRLQEPGGVQSYSRSIPIRRGVIQGDIPSPVVFLVALDKLLKDHGMLHTGLHITPHLTLSDLEFADDAALPNKDTIVASSRITNLNEKAKGEAGMSISVPKTKVQHIGKKPRVSQTTEADISNLPAEIKFKFICELCEMSYPTKHGLSIHKGRWCKGSKTASKPSRKQTVADRIVKDKKVEQYQNTLGKVKLDDTDLENVYAFVYLGAKIAGDGDHMVMVKHRCDIAWGRFGEYRKTLTSTKLVTDLKVRLYVSLVVSTMVYGSGAWFISEKIKRKLNNTNSKMLSLITKRSIHEEARDPSFDIIRYILQQRWTYLGHILRMDKNRAVRRYLLELSPSEAPFIPGTLLHDTPFRTVDEMITAAADREQWKAMYRV